MQSLILSNSDHRKAVGVRLRQLIDALGIKYVDAAKDMGVPKNHLGNWMRGSAYPTPYALYRFCRIRGVNTDWLFLADPSGLPQRVAKRLLEAEPGLADQPEAENRAVETQSAENA